MNTIDTPRSRWALKHAWHSESDRAALGLCAQALARVGVDFVDAADVVGADAVKLHGHELVEAREAGRLPLLDLGSLAAQEDWAKRVDPRAWRFMVAAGGTVHGIPMAIHQSNCAWANRRVAEEIGMHAPASAIDLARWLRLAAKEVKAPLAIGREPWQIGILFESLSLAHLGPDLYRRAFVELDPDVLGGAGMVRVLDALHELREFVDDGRLDAPWRALLADVSEGRSGVMLMGDWVRASGLPLHRLEVDGLRGACVHIVDLFVPIGASVHAHAVAAALTGPDFQARFAQVKGSAPAVVDAPARGRPAAVHGDVPSLTFDQCCGSRTKLALLQVVAEHFLSRGVAAATSGRLARIATEGA